MLRAAVGQGTVIIVSTRRRRTFFVSLGAGLLARAAQAPRPNVAFIISDDHGWTDYGFMRHPQVKTPHLDRLASEGLLFTRGYVPSSLCRPSLATMMTGLYPHQHRITGNDPPGDARDPANRARMTAIFPKSRALTSRLARAGYVSHQSGKWWEGQCTCCGFTECMSHGDVARGGRHGDEGLKIGRETMQPIYDFVDSAKGKPFFLWYAPFLPHTPHNPPERLLEKYLAPDRPVEFSRYWAMIEWLDETIGALHEFLAARKLADNTLILYLADNGWTQLAGRRRLFETRAKMSPYDAGVRTPIIVHWPGRITPRRDERTLVSSIDLVPTVLSACRLPADPALPGIDLRDTTRQAQRRVIYGANFVHTSVDIEKPAANLKYRWLIHDRYKLIAPWTPNLAMPLWDDLPDRTWSEAPEVYDILADPRETNDLAGRRPGLVKTLSEGLDQWWNPAAETAPPAPARP